MEIDFVLSKQYPLNWNRFTVNVSKRNQGLLVIKRIRRGCFCKKKTTQQEIEKITYLVYLKTELLLNRVSSHKSISDSVSLLKNCERNLTIMNERLITVHHQLLIENIEKQEGFVYKNLDTLILRVQKAIQDLDTHPSFRQKSVRTSSTSASSTTATPPNNVFYFNSSHRPPTTQQVVPIAVSATTPIGAPPTTQQVVPMAFNTVVPIEEQYLLTDPKY